LFWDRGADPTIKKFRSTYDALHSCFGVQHHYIDKDDDDLPETRKSVTNSIRNHRRCLAILLRSRKVVVRTSHFLSLLSTGNVEDLKLVLAFRTGLSVSLITLSQHFVQYKTLACFFFCLSHKTDRVKKQLPFPPVNAFVGFNHSTRLMRCYHHNPDIIRTLLRLEISDKDEEMRGYFPLENAALSFAIMIYVSDKFLKYKDNVPENWKRCLRIIITLPIEIQKLFFVRCYKVREHESIPINVSEAAFIWLNAKLSNDFTGRIQSKLYEEVDLGENLFSDNQDLDEDGGDDPTLWEGV
jgi:hypothetical protein